MSTQSHRYEPLPRYETEAEVAEALAEGSIETLAVLALSVGEHWPDGVFAQRVCVQLAEHDNPIVRANACLGLAYIARTKRQLDRGLVEPILQRELARQTGFGRGRLTDAISDIMGRVWMVLATAHLATILVATGCKDEATLDVCPPDPPVLGTSCNLRDDFCYYGGIDGGPFYVCQSGRWTTEGHGDPALYYPSTGGQPVVASGGVLTGTAGSEGSAGAGNAGGSGGAAAR